MRGLTAILHHPLISFSVKKLNMKTMDIKKADIRGDNEVRGNCTGGASTSIGTKHSQLLENYARVYFFRIKLISDLDCIEKKFQMASKSFVFPANLVG